MVYVKFWLPGDPKHRARKQHAFKPNVGIPGLCQVCGFFRIAHPTMKGKR